MNFTTIKCPNCDADLKIKEDTQYCECDYCHRKLFIDDGVARIEIHETYTNEAQIKKQEVKDKMHERELKYENKKIKYVLIACCILFGISFLGMFILYIDYLISTKDTITMPEKSRYYLGRDYEVVQLEMEDLGFTNIEIRTIDDLVIGFLSKEGEVESISIAGIKKFKKGDTFKKDDKVVITYHVFPEKKKNKK